MFTIGMRPGEVYTEQRAVRGACPAVGTRGTDSSGNIFILLKVGASQNLTNGLAVTFNVQTLLTTLGTAALASGVPNIGPVAIVHCSVTASTSSLVWAQIYGNCAVAVFSASASALPGAAVRFGANGALTSVSPVLASASATAGATFSVIAGLTCAATNSVINSPVAKVFLNFPAVMVA